ncbi:MAG: glutamate ligase domain-containing protein, partial [Blastocatellia bacterium]
DSLLVRELTAKAFCRVETFGTCREAQWRADNIDFSGELTTFDVLRGGHSFGRYRSPLAGMFNVRNCLGVIAACESLGLERDAIADSLVEFKSVKRRMEVRGVVRGVTVIDDFAHHPTAVRETLQGARQKYPGGRLIAVFEPRSYTAQLKVFQRDFEESLALADVIVVAGLFHPERYTSQTGASPQEMSEHLRAFGKDATYLPGPEEIVEMLVRRVESGDVVVVMSNGSFGGIHGKLLSALAG